MVWERFLQSLANKIHTQKKTLHKCGIYYLFILNLRDRLKKLEENRNY